MPVQILTLTCPDGPGIIHALTGTLLDVEANVLEQEQYSDPDSRLFFSRTRFDTPVADSAAIHTLVHAKMDRFNARVSVRAESDRRRVLILVSQYDHCLVDLLYRWGNGELPVDIVGVVSNHEVCREMVESRGLPFEHIAVTAQTKAASEDRIRELVRERDVDLVVMARYMQVLSPQLCEDLAGRALNIHHSFLPGFKGARPYHQAHERGVKLIGATAHFATADLDEGPIIEQEVHRVSHREQPERLAEIGRDIERLTLARAVRLFAEDRIFLNDHGTVVFG